MPSIRTFTGEFPCVDATLLPDNAAQETLDCNFSSGGVTGIRKRKTIAVPLQANPAKAMYVHADHGLASCLFTWPYVLKRTMTLASGVPLRTTRPSHGSASPAQTFPVLSHLNCRPMFRRIIKILIMQMRRSSQNSCDLSNHKSGQLQNALLL